MPELRLPPEEPLDPTPELRLPLEDRPDGGDTRDGAELREGELPVRICGADRTDLSEPDLGEAVRVLGSDVRDDDGLEPTDERELVRVEGREPTDERELGALDREPMVDRVRLTAPDDDLDGDVVREPTAERVLERVEVLVPGVEPVDEVPLVDVTPREVEPKADRVVRVPGSDPMVLLAVRVTSDVLVAVDVPPRVTFRVPISDLGSEASDERPPRVTPVVPRVRRPPDASDVRPMVDPRGAQFVRPLPTTTTPPGHHEL